MKRWIRILLICIAILVLVILGTIAYFIMSQLFSEEVSNSCTELGCTANTIYVGSVNSDRYYTCDCYYANRVLPENIICFRTDEEASNAGYIKSEC